MSLLEVFSLFFSLNLFSMTFAFKHDLSEIDGFIERHILG